MSEQKDINNIMQKNKEELENIFNGNFDYDSYMKNMVDNSQKIMEEQQNILLSKIKDIVRDVVNEENNKLKNEMSTLLKKLNAAIQNKIDSVS